MYKPGKPVDNPDEVLNEIIRIICDEQNSTPNPNTTFHSHSEAHGWEVLHYLWHIGAIVVSKDTKQVQVQQKLNI